MWRWRWNDQQNPDVSPRPLQEEAAGGGLRGGQGSLRTGRLSLGWVLVLAGSIFHLPDLLIATLRCGATGACWIAWFR